MQKYSPEYNTTKLWLAKLLRGDEPSEIPNEAVLLETAQAEGVTALCYENLRQSPIWRNCSESLRTALTKITYQEAALEMLRAEELRKILAVLAEHDLPVLIMKGAALAYTLYPKPHLRSRCDTDILLPTRKDAEHASEILQMIGYEQPMAVPGDLISYELGCYKKMMGEVNHTLDIHWGMSNSALFANRFSFNELKTSVIPIPKLTPQAYGLSAQHALLLACMHRINNLWPGIADRLIWIYDIHLLAESLAGIQWQEFATLAADRKLCGPCFDGLNMAHTLFNTDLPQNIYDRLQLGADKEKFNPNNAQIRWRYKWLIFRYLPIKTGLQLLLQYLFPDRKYLKNRYNFKGNLYLPWFYGLRLIQEFYKEISLKWDKKPKIPP